MKKDEQTKNNFKFGDKFFMSSINLLDKTKENSKKVLYKQIQY